MTGDVEGGGMNSGGGDRRKSTSPMAIDAGLPKPPMEFRSDPTPPDAFLLPLPLTAVSRAASATPSKVRVCSLVRVAPSDFKISARINSSNVSGSS